MMEYKYFRLQQLQWKGKTKKYVIISNSDNTSLGEVKWFGRWRQYCFFPDADTVWNKECLKDIIDFTDRMNQEHRATIPSGGRIKNVVEG